ncbi:MAG: ABC transporter ATP-binding protein/permease [Bacteroidia bacterium]|nr:ABC transporter ATP-binding protein/permease [Bacteroidia bacterium]MDW8089488.1 ABC transporter ATP-binding protein [Bacteroidia bacterium]
MGEILRLLWPFYRHHWKLGVAGVLISALVSLLALLPGWTVGAVVDQLASIQRASSVGKALLTVGGYLLGLWLFSILRALLMVAMRLTLVVLSRRIERDHRAWLFNKLLSQDYATLQKHSSGEILTYFTEDLNRLRNFTGPVVVYGLQTVFLLVFTVALMIYTQPQLGLASLLPLLLLGPLTYVLRQKAFQLGYQQQAAFAHLSGFLQQIYPYLRPLRALAQPEALLGEWERRSRAHVAASLAVTQVEAYLQPLTTLLVGLSLTIVLIYGGILVWAGKATLGVIGAFSLYLLQLLFPLGAIGWLISLIQQAKGSAYRLRHFQEEPSAISYPSVNLALPKYAGWEWKDLGFRYPNSQLWLFSHLEGALRAGEKVALRLPLGCGKTTFARLLIRQLEPTAGEIQWGGAPLRFYSRATLRQEIAYIPQQPVLLEGSIIANLRLAQPQATFREIWQALEWVGLAEEVTLLPKGLFSDIGIWGQQISGGQRQRLVLAMALLRRPRALILDETFAPLDSEKIVEILTHLQRHFGSATWLIITHRQEVEPFIDRWVEDFQAFSPKGRPIGAR